MSTQLTLSDRIEILCAQLKIKLGDLKSREAIREFGQAVNDDAIITGRRWLIWSHERKMWWRRSKWGYTEDINEAGRFTYTEALGITQQANINLNQNEKPEESMVYEQ